MRPWPGWDGERASREGSSRLRREYLSRLGIQSGDCREALCCRASVLLTTPPGRSRRDDDAEPLKGGDAALPDGADDACGRPPPLPVKEDFRRSLLQKLSYQQVWVPRARRAPPHQTVIIFDWDDTLMCTSFLMEAERERYALSLTVKKLLGTIEAAALRLLELAGKRGHTFIITNAMNGWVERSAATFAPGLLAALRCVRVISARGLYEAEFPGEVGSWKLHAFLEVQRQMNSQAVANLLSIGDSAYEMNAMQAMGKAFARAATKTVKFRERPTPEELLMQLELVAAKFPQIVESGRNLRMTLKRTD